ncbi:MAG: hypothetical protein E7033_05710 [Akkermansiaceae bacterium]|nr:hypothetical protein [Akkermansiaceae bacterium]
MKHILLATMLLPGAVMVSQAATLSFPEVPAAKEQAAKEGKPCLVVWYGSDWQPKVREFCKNWEAIAKEHSATFVFGQFDDKTGLKVDVRKKVLPIEHYNLPAVVLLAPDGTFMAEYDGAQVSQSPQKVMKKLIKLAEKAPEVAKLAQTAAKAQGAEAANAAGKALELLPAQFAVRCGALTGIIRKQDPEDTTGYKALFAMEHMAMYGEIKGILNGGKDGKLSGKDRKFDDAEAYVRKVLSNDRMQQKKYRHRRQQWLAGLAYVLRERIVSTTTPDKRDTTPIVKVYKELIQLDPDTQIAKGAKRFVHYWSPNTVTIIKNNFYDSGNQTLGFEKDWRVDVSKSIDGPGTYTFSLVPVDNGGMVTRNYRLLVNGKEVAKADAPADKNTKSVKFNVPALPKDAKVEVQLTAQCNDGWFGCSGHIRMQKD